MKLICTHNRDNNSNFPKLIVGKIYDCKVELIGIYYYALINDGHWTPIRFFEKLQDNRNKKINELLKS